MHKTILLADDEEMVLQVFTAMLEHLGYSVVCGRNGVEAFGIFRKDPNAIDLVLTDYYMPEMSGTDLARNIRRLGSDVPIVLITGLGFDLPGGLISSINIARMDEADRYAFHGRNNSIGAGFSNRQSFENKCPDRRVTRSSCRY